MRRIARIAHSRRPESSRESPHPLVSEHLLGRGTRFATHLASSLFGSEIGTCNCCEELMFSAGNGQQCPSQFVKLKACRIEPRPVRDTAILDTQIAYAGAERFRIGANSSSFGDPVSPMGTECALWIFKSWNR